MAWEWARMCAVGDRPAHGLVFGVGPAGVLSILAVAAAVLLAATGRYVGALVLLAAGAAAVTAVGLSIQGGRGRWHGFGTLYIGLPSIAGNSPLGSVGTSARARFERVRHRRTARSQ